MSVSRNAPLVLSFKSTFTGIEYMKNLEQLILRQIVFALIPLPDMSCRSGQAGSNMPSPISLVGMKL